ILGWPWVLLAGVLGGALKGRFGWVHGAVGVGLSWAALWMGRFVGNADYAGRMTELLGNVLGNLSPAAVVGFSVLIGLIIGALGGLIGTQLRLLILPKSVPPVSLKSTLTGSP
ncbi:MAG: hypothetical protein AAF752_12850, partial [Bacteroidota bacterium]